eukprot:jgi/Chrzof1/1158/Cz01g42210.t1
MQQIWNHICTNLHSCLHPLHNRRKGLRNGVGSQNRKALADYRLQKATVGSKGPNGKKANSSKQKPPGTRTSSIFNDRSMAPSILTNNMQHACPDCGPLHTLLRM